MKPLPPTLREKTRYMKFRIYSREEVEFGELVEEVWEALLQHLGSKGAGEASIWIMKNQFDEDKQEGVIKIRREREEDVRTALTLIDNFNRKKGFLEITGVSGSIKKLG
ncbi:MAG: Rpp14/Pop5 family protein [Candidatus Nanohaloarchaea archaeon]